MKNRVRMQPDDRRELLLNAAIKEAEKHGFNKICRATIAGRVGCSPGLIRHYWSTMKKLERAVLGEAIRTGNEIIIAQGLAARHPRVKNISDELKQKALASL